jgi:hypothetical protein
MLSTQKAVCYVCLPASYDNSLGDVCWLFGSNVMHCYNCLAETNPETFTDAFCMVYYQVIVYVFLCWNIFPLAYSSLLMQNVIVKINQIKCWKLISKQQEVNVTKITSNIVVWDNTHQHDGDLLD